MEIDIDIKEHSKDKLKQLISSRKYNRSIEDVVELYLEKHKETNLEMRQKYTD